jgi:hypothetical protein
MTKLNLQTEQLKKIRQLTKVEKARSYQFLGYSLDLETGEFLDLFEKSVVHNEWALQNITALLVHYSLAYETPKSGKLIKFRDLPGGYAYENAFIQRAVNPIAQVFGNSQTQLVEAAKLLKGNRVDFGELSVEIPALEGIPLIYILWVGYEFSASANVLFDESARCFLDTESLAVLGELTTQRLLKAHSIIE